MKAIVKLMKMLISDLNRFSKILNNKNLYQCYLNSNSTNKN